MDNVVRKLALGTVNFGMDYGIANKAGQVDGAEVSKILRAAQHAGIKTLDTAVAYGSSEKILGRAGVEGFQVVTKIPRVIGTGTTFAKRVEDQIKQSIALLGGHKLYAVMLHAPDQLSEADGPALMQALVHIRELGLVEKIGISIYHTNSLDALWGWFEPDIVQAPFNIFDQRLLTTGWASLLDEAGTEIHLRSTFLQGLLLMPRSLVPKQFSPWAELFEHWFDWQISCRASALELAIQFNLSQPWADKIVVGVETAQQLKDLIAAAQGELPEIPRQLRHGVTDEGLINPSKWTELCQPQ